MDPTLSFGGIESASGVLTDILAMFMRLLNNGGQKIIATEMHVAGALLAYQYLKLVLRVGFGTQAIKDGILGFIVAAAWYQVATNGVAVTMAYTSWMGSLGSYLSEGGMSGDVMHNPSKILKLGLDAFTKLLDQADSYDVVTGLVFLLVFAFLGLGVLMTMIMIGIVAIYTVLRATLDTLLGLALLPFVIEDQLKPLAAQGIGMIIGSGVALARTSLVVGATYGFLEKIRLQPTPTLRDGINLAAATLVLTFLCLAVSEVGGALSVYLTGKRL